MTKKIKDQILEKIFHHVEIERGGMGTRVNVYDVLNLIDKGWKKKLDKWHDAKDEVNEHE